MNIPPELLPVFESISHFTGIDTEDLIREALEEWLSCNGRTLLDRRRNGMFLVPAPAVGQSRANG